MLSFNTGSAGSFSGRSAATYLTTEFIKPTQEQRERYFAGETPLEIQDPATLEDVLRNAAAAVFYDRLTFPEAVEALINDWERAHPMPSVAVEAAWADANESWDAKQKRWVTHPHAPPPPTELWQNARFEAEGILSTKLDFLVDRLDALQEQQGSVARISTSLDPAITKLLKIDTKRPPSIPEIAHLLAGKRTDGQPIPDKEIHRPMRSVNAVFGLPGDRLPNPQEIDRVIASNEPARKRLLRAYKVPKGSEPTPVQINHMKAGRAANGRFLNEASVKRQLSATKAPIAYIDLTWSADKSVSIAWALAPTDGERLKFEQAHKAAVDQAMRYVEQALGFVHTGEPGRVAWLAFDHYTSRPTTPTHAADMQLHTHATLLNAVLTPQGKVGGIDLDRLSGTIKRFGRVYQANLAQNLRQHGIAVQLDRETGAAVLPAIPSRVRAHFSKGSQEIERAAVAWAKEHGKDWATLNENQKHALLRKSATAVRQDKATAPKDDFSEWKQQAEQIGYHHRSVLRPSALPVPISAPERRHEAAWAASLPLIEQALATTKQPLTADILAEHAVSGMVTAGISDNPAADIKAVLGLYRARGVRQAGEMTQVDFTKAGSVRGQPKWVMTTQRDANAEQSRATLQDIIAHLTPDQVILVANQLNREGITMPAPTKTTPQQDRETQREAQREAARQAAPAAAANRQQQVVVQQQKLQQSP